MDQKQQEEIKIDAATKIPKIIRQGDRQFKNPRVERHLIKKAEIINRENTQ